MPYENLSLKNITTWSLFAGIPFCINAVTQDPYSDYFDLKKNAIQNINVARIVYFIINSITFSLPIELLLVPTTFLLSMLIYFSSLYKKNESVQNLLTILFVLGFIVFVFFGAKGQVKLHEKIWSLDLLTSLSVPFILSILCIPIAYLYMLISLYEITFIRFSFFAPPEFLKKREYKIAIFRTCLFSCKKIKSFEEKYLNIFYKTMDEDFFYSILNKFKSD